MDENVKDQSVLLVKENDSNELKVVAGTDEKGKLKKVPASKENEQDFLKINKHGNILENFFENFKRQYKDPSQFMFFKAPLEKLQEVFKKIEDALKKPDDPASKKTLDTHKVDPETFGQKTKRENAIDESKVDWKQLEKLGVTKESLEKNNSLNALLNWQKTPVLITLNIHIDDNTKLRTDARLALREAPDGTLNVAIHALRKEPELDRPYFNIQFNEEDKKNLQTTGNLGRIAQVEYQKGQPTPVYLSIDKLTNELVALRTEKIKIPNEIKDVVLTDMQKKELAEGKAVYLEGMIAKSGKPFDASIQINADKRGIEFLFDQQPKQNQQQSQQQNQQQDGEHKRPSIPQKLGGVELSQQQQKDLHDSKTIYVAGMIDKQGQEYSAYVKVNPETGRLNFFKWNPDKAKEVTPDNASKTQVAVNTDGKTNEATKNVKEPLQKGQAQPTEKQAEKQEKEQKKAVKKSRGI